MYSTPPVIDESKYANITWWEYIKMKANVWIMPFYITYEIIFSPFLARSKHKPLSRVIGDQSFRYVTDYLPGPQLQYFLGTSVGIYQHWARQRKLPVTVDELEDGGKLLWIGPKRTKKVLLYCHGGAYIFPLQEFTITFWRYIQSELEKQGMEIGIAIMSYSLVPAGVFPAQLWQASRAIQHLLTIENVIPSNLLLTGDSAGGNLVSQILSSLVHPIFSPPLINLPIGTRLKGAYMMSPWIALAKTASHTGSFRSNDHSDVIGASAVARWGATVLESISPPENPSSASPVDSEHPYATTVADVIPYVDPLSAPEDVRKKWFKGLDGVVERVLVSTGEGEILRDPDRYFFKGMIEPWMQDKATFYEQPKGVHNDPFFDFQVSKGPLIAGKTLTPVVLEWVATSFRN